MKRTEQIDCLERALIAIAQVRDSTLSHVVERRLAELHTELYEVRDLIRNAAEANA